VEGVDVDDNTIPTYSFTNLNFRYEGGEMIGGAQWSVSFAINNAFNKLPIILPGTPGRVGTQIGSGSGNHDEFGRRYQVTLDMNF
jgi:outer membrane receptor protein involved in Fe transport